MPALDPAYRLAAARGAGADVAGGLDLAHLRHQRRVTREIGCACLDRRAQGQAQPVHHCGVGLAKEAVTQALMTEETVSDESEAGLEEEGSVSKKEAASDQKGNPTGESDPEIRTEET